MNKTVLKNFAINARLELLARVRDRATFYGITDEKIRNNQIVTSNAFQKMDGQLLNKNEIAQRNALLQRIQNNGYSQVMEEAAYTWFNRFIAIKYMEVHKLLPIDQRVIPQQAGELPQIVREAQNVTLEGIDFDTVIQYLDNNRTEDLYKFLVIALCNQLSGCLPQMFEKISDYTELLFPDGLMKAESFLGMLAKVSDENWQAIQAVGWLYQYYNTDLKDETFSLLKNNIKITKDRIGAATQLFTPDWIVRYMVENSLGRLWYEGHPNCHLKTNWRYYIDEAQQEPEVEKKLVEIRKEREKLQPEAIKLIDPCMGSGHILVYAFDVLMDIYRSVGYTDRDAVQSIIKNNIWGLDIDDRAAQLAYFALMMKATEYDKRFLKRNLQPNICAIQESNELTEFDSLQAKLSIDTICLNTAKQLISSYIDAKEYGSLLTPKVDNPASVDSLLKQLEEQATVDLEISAWYEKAKHMLPQLTKQTIILQQFYDVTVTNPPYMGNKNLSPKVAKVLKNAEVTDMYQLFMLRTQKLLKRNGELGIITKNDWLKKSKSEALRRKIYKHRVEIIADLGPHAFEALSGEIVGFCILIYSNAELSGSGLYIDASETADKEKCLILYDQYKKINNDAFEKVPRFTIYPQMRECDIDTFKNSKIMDDIAQPKSGMTTGDSERFIHNWYEVPIQEIGRKWFPVNVGGTPAKWYGNKLAVIDWENNGQEIKDHPGCTMANMSYQQREGITWGKIASGHLCVRYSDGAFFTASGLMAFPPAELLIYIMCLLNSKVSDYFLDYFRNGLDILSGDIANIPIKFDTSHTPRINELGKECIQLAKEDWDSREVSEEFLYHPLLTEWFSNFSEKHRSIKISDCYELYRKKAEERYCHIKSNEEEINRIFISIYELGDILSPNIDEKEVTIKTDDLLSCIKSLISYAVGCMFGRYSLTTPGVKSSKREIDESQYNFIRVDKDGILPITDDEYLEDDIVSSFVEWVKAVFGEDYLEENLQFIASALSDKRDEMPRDVIRNYFLNGFYSDHLKVYQKKPIYWQLNSGKQNGIKALLYFHRYDQSTIARFRTDYVHELQDRYRTQLQDAQLSLGNGDNRQQALINRRIQKIEKQISELNKYEEKVHHYADMKIKLDSNLGISKNYKLLEELLTKI